MKTRHYNFGLIGNCSLMGCIDDTANIVWLCLPKFDSSFIFGSLLDKKKGGEFYIRPASKNYTNKQYYMNNTNILCTEFTTDDGAFRVIDFAPRFKQFDRYFRPQMVVRKIELISGNPFVKIACKPVSDYGKVQPEVVTGSNHIRYYNIGTHVRLTTDISLSHIIEEKAFVLSENKYMVFSYGVPLEAAIESTLEDFLVKTQKYWTEWIKSTSIINFHQDEIIRSALILKLHQYEDTGAIIAAGTTSLPEYDQTSRNWDYRYCWLRDTYYTLTAFNNVGHFEELEKYFEYIENIILSENDRLQPLYSITGDKKIYEKELNLEGYLNNKPVRIGNAAYEHIQNDVYGQLLATLLPLFTDKRLNNNDYCKNLKIIHWLTEKISKTIMEPDCGLWEFRNKKQFHTFTYLFHWIGSKAAGKIAEYYNDAQLKDIATSLNKIASDKLEQCYNPKLNCYTQAISVNALDASTLQLITMNYLEHDTDQAKNHLKALEKGLMTKNGLFYRYLHADDFGTPKSTFVVCTFWYIEALACVGRIDEAIMHFENILQYSNHLGIFSEDIDEEGNQWGNFPQSYSHVGLMNAAYRIANRLDHPIFL